MAAIAVALPCCLLRQSTSAVFRRAMYGGWQQRVRRGRFLRPTAGDGGMYWRPVALSPLPLQHANAALPQLVARRSLFSRWAHYARDSRTTRLGAGICPYQRTLLGA